MILFPFFYYVNSEPNALKDIFALLAYIVTTSVVANVIPNVNVTVSFAAIDESYTI
jgi:hypothetical protein